MEPPCVHCGETEIVIIACRGLCSRCYYNPSIRREYPLRESHLDDINSRADLDKPIRDPFIGPIVPPGWPCHGAPYSTEKLATLVARYERGEWLWHPLDNVQMRPNKEE